MKTNQLIRLTMGAVCSFAAVGTVKAVDQTLLEHPVPAIAERYRNNAAEVDALENAAIAQGSATDRLRALRDLATRYPEAATVVARKLVQDGDTEVAQAAIAILMKDLVMSDHAPVDHDKLLPRIRYLMQSHEQSKAALRPAIADERKPIRDAVAPFLASKSDRGALDEIAKGAEKGLYTDIEAANFYTLARGPVGQTYMAKYLGKGGVAAQQTAISYLGVFDQYQEQIRTAYFSNPKAGLALRTEAADVLSRYDSRFAEYALDVATPKTKPVLFEASVSGYVNALQKENRLDAAKAGQVSDTVDLYVRKLDKSIPATTAEKLKNLQLKLDSIEKQSD